MEQNTKEILQSLNQGQNVEVPVVILMGKNNPGVTLKEATGNTVTYPFANVSVTTNLQIILLAESLLIHSIHLGFAIL